ncbi:MAG: response regulator transcription factor [Candidatus Paceibacterota bacterium]
MTILVVEDEEKIRDILKKGLTSQNYTVELASDGEEGLEKALHKNYSLIVLDLMLPKKDGMEVCRELRSHQIHTPILILTARGVTEDKIQGLDLGADDYLIKPFDMNELFARIRALLRRRRTSDSLIFKAGDLVMDTKAHEVARAGKKISLTPKEYKILDTLLRQKGEAITREQLLIEAWGNDFTEDNHELNVHIKYLRNKIDKGYSKALIHTIRGVGYAIKD